MLQISAKNLESDSNMTLCLVLGKKWSCQVIIVKNGETEFSLPPTLFQDSENFESSVVVSEPKPNLKNLENNAELFIFSFDIWTNPKQLQD